MSQLIGREAASFDGDARRAQAIAHDLGAAVEADTGRDRARGAAVTKQFAVSHPDLLGTWVAYEPNAYGRDAALRQPRPASATTRAASRSGPSA